MQDTGSPVVDPDQKDAPAKKVRTLQAKEVSGDPAQKGEGKPKDAMEIKASEGYTDEEIREMSQKTTIVQQLLNIQRGRKIFLKWNMMITHEMDEVQTWYDENYGKRKKTRWS